MAVEDFGGSVNGAPIEVLSADHQNKPDVGSNIVREWIDVQDVDVIVDVPTSSVALAVTEIVKEKDRVFLVSGAATTELTGAACSRTPFTGPTIPMRSRSAPAAPWFRRAAIRGSSSPPTTRSAIQLEADTAAIVEKEGGQVLGSVRHPLSSSVSRPTCCRPGLGRPGDRARECRHRHHQRDQAGERVRHHSRPASSSHRC